jgi:EAL domain-containing protein (putative c-di-GMP-specific phosphodiesterase class I)
MRSGHPAGPYPDQANMQTSGAAAVSQDADEEKTSLCFVIDSEPVFRQDFSNRLRGAGVTIVEFQNSAHLPENLDDQIPDVVFLNVNAGDPFDCVRALTFLGNSSFSGRVQLFGRCEPGFFESIRRFGQHLSLTMLAPMTKPVDFAAIRKLVREQKLVRVPPGANELSLSQALANEWATFWYQPKVDPRNKQLVGAEALVRFIHPQHGVVSPGYFLGGSREEDLQELAKLALEHALKVSANFERQGIQFALSLNVSVESLLKLPVAELVQKHRPQRGQWAGLAIEVSERQAINRINLLRDKSDELSRCGISLALDNCGRGNTSFQMLDQIKFSEIKIDQFLVRDCDKVESRSNTCKTIVQMAHNFSMKTTAVGVETPHETQRLATFDCDFYQGYLFGKPMNEFKLLDMVRKSRGDSAQVASPNG